MTRGLTDSQRLTGWVADLRAVDVAVAGVDDISRLARPILLRDRRGPFASSMDGSTWSYVGPTVRVRAADIPLWLWE